MDTDELVQRIRDGERFAPDAAAVLAAVVGAGRARRRRRLAVQVGSVAAAVAVIAVTSTVVLANRSDTPARPPATVTPGPVASTTVLPTTVLPTTVLPTTVLPTTVLPTTVLPTTAASAAGTSTPAAPTAVTAPAASTAVTAADLAAYRWSTMPKAPIRDRDQAALGWTGTEMIVWGGVADDGKTDMADGAAYDPIAKTWRVLPAAPLDPRVPQASVWTGTEFIVWGGDKGQTDGAAYDPATDTWRAIPAVPGPTAVGGSAEMSTGAAAAWTGDVVQLLTWRYQGSAVQSWYYSPSRNSWTAGESIEPAPNAWIADVELVAGADRLDALVAWSVVTPTADGSQSIDRVSGYARTSGDPSWRAVDYRPALGSIGPLVDSGTGLVIGPTQPYRGFHSGPYFVVPGVRLDPGTGTVTALPAVPKPGQMDVYQIVWTGSALLGFGSNSYTEGADGTKHLPGAAAAWDPATNAWTVLRPAPLAPYATVSGVWTGTELLTWGLMFPADQANTRRPDVRASGLVFAPTG